MRPQLKQFEQIESYVLGLLSASEVTDFEKAMENSSELAGLVEFQTFAIQASKRRALRAEIAAATNSGSSGLSGKWMWIFVALILAAGTIGAAIYMNGTEEKFRVDPLKSAQFDELFSNQETDSSTTGQNNSDNNLQEQETTNDPSAVDSKTAENKALPTSTPTENEVTPWIPFDKQHFTVNAKDGGTLEGTSGSLIVVPSNAFLNDDGNIVKGDVQLELIEAIEWEDMLAYNLTTMNDGKALSSGGMLYIQPYQHGEKIQINPDKPLYIEIPTDEFDPEMMAWEGEAENGDINWKSPTPLKRFLTKVDLALLDFIPSGFDSEVEANLPYKNHTETSDHLVDSLYFALGKTFLQPAIIDSESEAVEPEKGSSFSNISPTPREMLMKRKNRKKHDQASKEDPYGYEMEVEANNQNTENCCYIDPLSIQTILDPRFQNTFIATKEFEARLQAMHKHANGQGILDIYLANIDKDMVVSDKLAIKLVDDEDKAIFQAFIDEQATNIDANIYQEQLSAFYEKKRREYSNDLKKRQERYREQTTAQLKKLQSELLAMTNTPNSGKRAKSAVGVVASPVAAVGVAPPQPSVAQTSTYATQWFKPGWVNIDKYLHLLEKGAPKEVLVSINGEQANGKVYQCIDVLKTIIPLNVEEGQAMAKFPNRTLRQSERMEKSYCLAIAKNKDGLFYSERKYNPYSTDHVYLNWEKIDQNELYNRLKQLSPHNSALIKSLKEEEKYLKQQLAIREKQNDVQREQQRVMDVQQQDQAMRTNLLTFLDQCDAAATTMVPSSAPIASSADFEFTPDGDGNNDFYYMSFGKHTIRNFNLQIYNQRDMLVFETSDPYFRWDGENLAGFQCEQGLYYVRYSYKKNSQKRKEQGNQVVSLKRNGTNF